MEEADKSRQQLLAQYVGNMRRFPRVRFVFWLLRCTDALNKYADDKVGEKGDNRTKLSVLLILAEYPDGIPQQAIAKQTGRSKQAIAVAIDNLENNGYVIRCSDSNDRRVNSIRITKDGVDHLNKVYPHMVEMCKKALHSLSNSDIDQMLPLVIKLTKSLLKKNESQSLGT